jgi:hypothetical protein
VDFVFSDMFNFRGINWWTLLGGMGLNFLITTLTSFLGAYLGSNEPTAQFYAQYGSALLILVIFGACLGAGFITGKLADDVPVKHAFLSSLGAFVPLIVGGVMSFNPLMLMSAAVAVAGNLNGGIMSQPKSRRSPPPMGRG